MSRRLACRVPPAPGAKAEAADKPDNPRLQYGVNHLPGMPAPSQSPFWWERIHDALATQREMLSRIMADNPMSTQSREFWMARALGTLLDAACQQCAAFGKEVALVQNTEPAAKALCTCGAADEWYDPKRHHAPGCPSEAKPAAEKGVVG